MLVSPGQKLNIPARDWNDLQSMLRRFRAAEGSFLADGPNTPYVASVVWVKNTSSSDVEPGDVLGLGDPVTTPSSNAAEFRSMLAFEGSAPSTSTPHYGQYGIVQESAVKTKGFCRCVVDGVTFAKLTITHASDQYCEITNNVTTALTTGALGTSRVLWKESGTGSSKWGLIRVGNESREILVYNATGSAIGAAASGTATVYTGTPGSEASSGQTLTVYNRTSVNWSNAKYGWAHAYRGNFYVVPIQS